MSLCQFFALFGDREFLVVLFDKHGLDSIHLTDRSGGIGPIRNAVDNASDEGLASILDEMLKTFDSVRHEINPKYKFHDRWDDLLRCLELDDYRPDTENYGKGVGSFVPIEPTIEGVDKQQIEDDLTAELFATGLSEVDDIKRRIAASASAFLGEEYNGCLTNARVALETLARSMSRHLREDAPGEHRSDKWGAAISEMRKKEFISEHEEHGLTGVYSFISEGAHKPVGLTDQEYARLGRSLALSFSYLLLKKFNANRRSH